MRATKSEGEKMIYAAAFAGQLDLFKPPSGLCVPSRSEERAQWERDQVVQAAEYASSVVELYREAGKRIREGWGEQSEDFEMFVAMTSREER